LRRISLAQLIAELEQENFSGEGQPDHCATGHLTSVTVKETI
jgi:hypothetical protein